MVQLTQRIVLAIAAIQVAAAEEDRAGSSCPTDGRFLATMQIPDKDVGLESGAAVARVSREPMGSAASRTKITCRHTAIRVPDPGSEVGIRQVEIRPVSFSDHFRTRRGLLLRRGDRV
jgi:hypothetical protein